VVAAGVVAAAVVGAWVVHVVVCHAGVGAVRGLQLQACVGV
jgi:hypothetical protein